MWGWHCIGTAFPAMEMVFDEHSGQRRLGRLSLEKESLPDGWLRKVGKNQNQNH